MTKEIKSQFVKDVLIQNGTGLSGEVIDVLVEKIIAIDDMPQEQIDVFVAEQNRVKREELQAKIDEAQGVIDTLGPILRDLED